MVEIRRSELQELVDSPNETLEVEYKEWLDLAGSNEARADLARHLAALANCGGGVIVFGITDAMKFAGDNPFPQGSVDRDLVAGIVKKYLEPTFQCDIQIVKSAAGNDHPVIIVPPHRAVPICAKAGGPVVDGRPRGIVQGVHYTRKAGPESAPILTAAEWGPIIRRCAMHERSAILTAIDASLRGASSSTPSSAEELKIWHDAVRPVYLRDIGARNVAPFYSSSYYLMSYAIDRADGQLLDPGRLIQILLEVHAEVRELVYTGWSMFFPFTRRGIEPFFNADENSGQGERDFLECALLRDDDPNHFRTEMWRIAVDGKAAIIRGYLEDFIDFAPQTGLAQGTWFSPNMMVCALVEIVRHARGMAERFNEATNVQFRCEWHGLNNRGLFDPIGRFLGNYRARRDALVSTGTWPATYLANGLEEIVAKLGQPAIRTFTNEFVLTPEWVKGQRGRWRI
jgi:hypothetical protein